MPVIQLLHYCSHSAFLTSGGKHDPGSGYLFVRNTPTADASDRNIIDKPTRMCKKTILDFDRGYLGTRDFEYILKFKSGSVTF